MRRLAVVPASRSRSRSCPTLLLRPRSLRPHPRSGAEEADVSNRRDKLIALGAAALVVILALSVVTAVLSAERNGRRALEDLQLAQLQQLARVLDGALGPALTSKVGLTNPTTGQPWALAPADAADQAGL